MTSLLAKIFTSHAVLQRGVPIPIYGNAAASTLVDASFGGVTMHGIADATGRWTVEFPAMTAGGPFVIFANSSTGATAQITDVYSGDLILCGGQSNMDMPVSYAFNSSAEAAAAAAYPLLRYVTVTSNYSSTPLFEFGNISSWEIPTPASSLEFSAVCWYAVRDTFDALRAAGEGEVAMGMIHSALGGTAIQEWQNAVGAAACPLAQPPIYPTFSRLYNAMIAPFVLNHFRISHVIFYQGEQNVIQNAYYACMLTALSDSWQADFSLRGDGSNGNGRFFVAQLHAWNASVIPGNVDFYGAVAAQRLAQAAGVAASPGSELATAIDGGDPLAPETSIHPRNKQLPGFRLAQAIVARRYGLNIAYAAPRYASSSASTSGAQLTVSIVLSGNAGLIFKPPTPDSKSTRCPTDLTVPLFMCAAFEIMLDDAPFPNGTWVSAAAVVDAPGTGITLTATATTQGQKAAGSRNGWAAWPIVNIYTLDGNLPVLPWIEPVTQ